MPTPRIRPLVSLAVALAATLAVAGCAGAPARLASDGMDGPAEPSVAVHFDNRARDHAHVYLIGERREWLLGRVEPGRRVSLRVPDAALTESPWSMRLAVLTGQRVTLRAAGHPRASITMAQPVGQIVSLHWTFSQTPGTGELAGFRHAGAQATTPRR